MIKVFVRSLIPFSVLLYVISLVALGYTSFPRDFISSIFVNSDSVFHTYYVQEIFQAGKDPRTWLLPHSFLIFPEFMLFLVVRLVVGGNVGLVNFITGVLTFAVVQLSVVFLIVNAFDFNKNRVAQVFTLLTVGDGLVTQIPALIISTAAGLLVTRNTNDDNIGSQVQKQFKIHPKAIYISGAVLVFFGLIPGLPKLPFFAMGAALGFVAFRIEKGIINQIDDIIEDKPS